MKNKPKFKPDPNLKLMDQVRQVLRYHHYAYRTEETYCKWIVRFLKHFNYQIHPRDMGKSHIEAYLSHLAVQQNVAAATQRQALNAIMFLFREVLNIPMEEEVAPVKAKKYPRPPVVMTQSEVESVLNEMQGTHLLMARLLYGGGLRLMECVRLRVQNIDFEKNHIYVRGAKGGKDRVTLLPGAIREDLQNHLLYVKQLHREDLANGYGEVYLPHGLERKYPHAAKEWGWQYVFPAKKLSKDPRSGKLRRHHVLESRITESRQNSGTESRYYQEGQLSYLPAQLCHPPTGKRGQYPRRARTHGTCRCENHRNLYSCDGKRYFSGFKSVGSINPQ